MTHGALVSQVPLGNDRPIRVGCCIATADTLIAKRPCRRMRLGLAVGAAPWCRRAIGILKGPSARAPVAGRVEDLIARVFRRNGPRLLHLAIGSLFQAVCAQGNRTHFTFQHHVRATRSASVGNGEIVYSGLTRSDVSYATEHEVGQHSQHIDHPSVSSSASKHSRLQSPVPQGMFCSSRKRTSGGGTIGTTLVAVHDLVPEPVHFVWQYSTASSLVCPRELRLPEGGIAKHVRNFSTPQFDLECVLVLYL